MMTPGAFAASVQGALKDPYWMGATKATPQVPDLTGKLTTVQNDNVPGTFAEAARRALAAVNPFSSAPGPTELVAKSGADMLKSGADAVGAAGHGITSGFRWATILVVLALIGYLFLLVSPFLPRPGAK